ncbi:hypothetical protein B0T26DRAFT_672240 [Lasiosphaeria miniovina]|uniref:Uncharacterized protein n=1 Tax=Lasiosphaeria miniovina TaxID=1954250 RepID=A0AA40E776_9PEZI|nr:uncharacterized protein B0T26DRAFT_672240 [Lasiosphaeria miniovina]KAK0727597.1 hypothetical protein B0T26DRAFT_672240 [Lasiosphaeria miniovina]
MTTRVEAMQIEYKIEHGAGTDGRSDDLRSWSSRAQLADVIDIESPRQSPERPWLYRFWLYLQSSDLASWGQIRGPFRPTGWVQAGATSRTRRYGTWGADIPNEFEASFLRGWEEENEKLMIWSMRILREDSMVALLDDMNYYRLSALHNDDGKGIGSMADLGPEDARRVAMLVRAAHATQSHLFFACFRGTWAGPRECKVSSQRAKDVTSRYTPTGFEDLDDFAGRESEPGSAHHREEHWAEFVGLGEPFLKEMLGDKYDSLLETTFLYRYGPEENPSRDLASRGAAVAAARRARKVAARSAAANAALGSAPRPVVGEDENITL